MKAPTRAGTQLVGGLLCECGRRYVKPGGNGPKFAMSYLGATADGQSVNATGCC